MARFRKADQGLIFASCIFNHKEFSLDRLETLWRGRYQLSGVNHPKFNPSLQYYSKEMGPHLQRVIIWSDLPYEREEMVAGKLWADCIERESSIAGKRTVNIDVGLILKEQVLLSTSKPYSHRIYLRDGVWAELTYTYENKSYHFLPWTYPDYQNPEKVELFNSLRLGLFPKKS